MLVLIVSALQVLTHSFGHQLGTRVLPRGIDWWQWLTRTDSVSRHEKPGDELPDLQPLENIRIIRQSTVLYSTVDSCSGKVYRFDVLLKLATW